MRNGLPTGPGQSVPVEARNDLAGAEADSWDSILKADGFETEVIMKGLGEIDAIAEMFVKHLKKAESL